MSSSKRCARRQGYCRFRSLFGPLGRVLGKVGTCRCRDSLRRHLRLEALEPMILPNAVVASGAGSGAPPIVRVYDATTGKLTREFLAYDPTFTGGVNVATADLNGDGVGHIGTGPGGR